WEAVADGNPDWEAIFGDAQSTCDYPSARYYREILDFYPDAKVVMSVRTSDGWVRSMRETIWPMYWGDSVMYHVCQARRHLDRDWDRFIRLMYRMTWDEGSGGIAGDHESDEGLAAIMDRWNAQVIADVPAEKLLVWNPADGWEPLCEFLEVGVPDGPVPHVNDTAAFLEGILGGGMRVLNDWWDQREASAEGLHGATA
ncbi:MAG TPA: sulfotransferase, partial [Solirubrobacteraceae bacterium]|nr:sulfotransferase [Solirubrobacteraceae bacterium]